MNDLKEFLKNENIHYKSDVHLENYTYCKVGGNCQIYIIPTTTKNMATLIAYLQMESVPYTVIGETSNMIFLDDVVYGVIISTSMLNNIDLKDNKVKVDAGANLSSFLRLLYSKKISGFEGLEGIPGSVGGAVFMNAGAYGSEISEYISNVECLTLAGDIVNLSKNECDFTQRNSIFRMERNYIILTITFNLEVSNNPNYYKNIETYHIARHCYGEFVLPNVGSVFTAKRCVYEELCNVDWKYKIIYKILCRLFYNRLMKLINRKSPNRNIINQFTVYYFGLEDISGCFSIKHINMLANLNKSSWDFIDYIVKMKSILGDKVILENEIVTCSIVKPLNGIYNKYKEIIESARG